MTTLTSAQIVKAQTLRTAGTSLRQIARTLRVSHSTLKRALDQQMDGGTASTLERIRLERLRRLQNQNERLVLELEKMRHTWVERAVFEAQVVRYNTAVKMELLSLPYQLAPKLLNLAEPTAIQKILHDSIVRALNDLAYGTGERKEESHEDQTDGH
jgi:transposase